MATITINIPVDKEQWVLDGMALKHHYQETIPNPLFDAELPDDPQTNPSTLPNPETKAAFVKNTIIEMIKRDAMQGHINTEWIIKQAEADTTNLT